MTVDRLRDILDARVAVLGDGEREVLSGYCGDFLSNVMGKAPADWTPRSRSAPRRMR